MTKWDDRLRELRHEAETLRRELAGLAAMARASGGVK